MSTASGLGDFCASCGHEARWHAGPGEDDSRFCVASNAITHLPCACPDFADPDALAEYLEAFVREAPIDSVSKENAGQSEESY
jgi:hypothetical protein